MKHTNVTTARFWIRHNSDWVRISLKDLDVVDLYEGGETDEGSYGRWTTYSRDVDVITCDVEKTERCCDGRYDDAWICETTIDDLRAAAPVAWDPERPPVPQWEAIDSSQRDHSAEAAGY